MQSIVLLMWLALCTEQDIRERQLSNALTLGVAACALVWLFATGRSWIGAEPSDAGWALAIVMLLTLPGYMLGRFGAGDVKLMGALALATSPRTCLELSSAPASPCWPGCLAAAGCGSCSIPR